MSITLIHLSDIHYLSGRHENHGVVLDTLLKDIEQQLGKRPTDDRYLVISGDIAQSADDVSQYENLAKDLDGRLNSLGIPKAHRICVPGNHDISRKEISDDLVEHEGVVCQSLNEQRFNSYVSKQPNRFTSKFKNYREFEGQFAGMGVGASADGGAGWSISEDIAVYCLNTALCSTAGLEKEPGVPYEDKGRLAVQTRQLHLWTQQCTARWKILVMHHPIGWLCPWAENEIRTILRKDFALCLSGHTHDQAAYHSLVNGTSLIECSAPPLFTDKADDLGYALISVSGELGVSEIAYRQWTRHQTFVSGVNFSNSDDGRVLIVEPKTSVAGRIDSLAKSDVVDDFLSARLNQALIAFSSQPRVWVEPVLSTDTEVTKDAELKPKVEAATLVANPKSVFIIAPPLFGLTCLAHHLIREAWRTPKQAVWLYLDAKNLRPHKASIEAACASELATRAADIGSVECVVLDSWTNLEKDSYKILSRVCEYFKQIPVICMQTIDHTSFFQDVSLEAIGREFEFLYLWSLSRSQIRKLVADYNESRPIGDEDLVTGKIVADIEVMNIHRTPLNCLTLLKVSEVDFDESPVNRTEMIKRVLFLLFNVDDVPTYKNRPDLKDCEYVLGYFCESMMRSGEYSFSRDHFMSVLQQCCEERLIDLEVQVVFDVLYANSILVKRGSLFQFRFAYWIFYFAAQRMHHDAEFAEFIYQNMRYAKYPEIIEFYSGIDRRREDVVRLLIQDVKAACDAVQSRCGFPPNFNLFGMAQWKSSPEMLERMEGEISDGVKSSNLPAAIKDQYADRRYDRAKPYDQEIREILSEYSFVYLMQAMKAGARALRNSDYVNPELKRKLLQEILRCWEQTSLVLVVLLPILAQKGRATFGGVGVVLAGDFGDTFEKRVMNVLAQIPSNVVALCQDDLFSQKMGPLLIEQMETESSELRRHELLLLLIRQRPRGWKSVVQRYIASVSKNSLYLLDVYQGLRAQYRYSYASPQVLRDIEFLIRMAATKHVTGDKDPGVKLINKMKDKFTGGDILPKREI